MATRYLAVPVGTRAQTESAGMRELQKDDLLIDCGLAFAGAEYSAQHDAEEEIKEQNNDQPLTLHAHRRDEFFLDEAEEHRRHHERGQKRKAYDLTLCLLFRQVVLTLSGDFRFQLYLYAKPYACRPLASSR